MLKQLIQIGTIVMLIAGCKSFKVDGSAVSLASQGSPNPPPPMIVPTVSVTLPIPLLTKTRSAAIAFTTTPGTFAIQSVRCQLDSNPQLTCNGTFSVGNLSEGDHVIVVTVVDVQGNRAQATMNWTVKLNAPTIGWTSALPTTITAFNVHVDFSTSANAASTTCTLNGANLIGCTNTISYGGFFTGLNYLTVKSQDAAGNSRERHVPWFLKPTTTRTVPVSACMDISLAGLYQVTADITGALPASGATCINIHDTANVVFDCQGHTISAWNAFRITNVNNFTIQNCMIRSSGSPAGTGVFGEPMLGVSGTQQTIAITDSAQGDLDNNVVGENISDANYTILLKSSSRVLIQNNILNAMIHLSYSSDNIVNNNQINCPRASNSPATGRCNGVVVLGVNSNSNKIIENIIDGRGNDNGMLVFETDGNLISNNTIRNTSNLGIETYGNNKDLTVVDNALNNLGNGGIGGRWWMSMRDSRFARNIVDGAPTIFNFRRNCGLRTTPMDSMGLLTPDTGIFFENNKFEGNVLSNQSAGVPEGFQIFDAGLFDQSAVCGTVTAPTQTDFHLTANTFTNNDFSTTTDTYFGPATTTNVLDGGGNNCFRGTSPNAPIFCWDAANSGGI